MAFKNIDLWFLLCLSSLNKGSYSSFLVPRLPWAAPKESNKRALAIRVQNLPKMQDCSHKARRNSSWLWRYETWSNFIFANSIPHLQRFCWDESL